MSSATLPTSIDDAEEDDPSDRRWNRPVINPGDMLIGNQAQGRIILRKGGVLEIGASETCKRIYTPLTNLIQEYSRNWVHSCGGGRMSMITRDTDGAFGSLVPTEFQLSFREFEGDEGPMIDLRMGRIKAEEDQRIAVDTAEVGEIVYRFVINNRYAVYVDKKGNFQSKIAGASFTAYGRRRSDYAGSFHTTVMGLLSTSSTARSVTVSGNDTLTINGERHITSGPLTEIVDGTHAREVSGPYVDRVGSIDRVVSGTRVEQVASSDELSCLSRTVSTVQDLNEVVAGKRTTLVANSQLDGTAWEVQISGLGEAQIFNMADQTHIGCGGATISTSLGHLTIKPTGAMEFSSGLGVTTLEVNTTGISLSTAAGEITIDAAGGVMLGPAVGLGVGGVVTTATHPVFFVTGAPIAGSSSVGAGTGIAPLISPVPFIPPLFVPDVT